MRVSLDVWRVHVMGVGVGFTACNVLWHACSSACMLANPCVAPHARPTSMQLVCGALRLLMLPRVSHAHADAALASDLVTHAPTITAATR